VLAYPLAGKFALGLPCARSAHVTWTVASAVQPNRNGSGCTLPRDWGVRFRSRSVPSQALGTLCDPWDRRDCCVYAVHRLVSSSVLGRARALHARLFARCGNGTASTSPCGSWPHSRVPTSSSSLWGSTFRRSSKKLTFFYAYSFMLTPTANERLPALGSPVGTSSLRSLEPGPPTRPRTGQVRSPDPVARVPPAWTGSLLARLPQCLLAECLVGLLGTLP